MYHRTIPSGGVRGRWPGESLSRGVPARRTGLLWLPKGVPFSLGALPALAIGQVLDPFLSVHDLLTLMLVCRSGLREAWLLLPTLERLQGFAT
jgi:hypothetical protein